MIKKYPNISMYMTSRIVQFYFFLFRLILREILHFVFRIGLYKTDRSAISLRIASKTRTTNEIPTTTSKRMGENGGGGGNFYLFLLREDASVNMFNFTLHRIRRYIPERNH